MKPISRRSFISSAGALGVFCSVPLSTHLVAAPFNRSRIGEAPVSIERGFQKVSYGQLHYRFAQPLDPKKIKHRPVVCFHQTPISSQIYVEFMSQLAQDRLVYTVDTPGQGESDLLSSPPEVSDYAAIMQEFLEAKALTNVDLVGYHTGASIAIELALRTNNVVQHMMLAGIALFNQQEREGFFANPWPKPKSKDGSHLQTEWERSQFWRGPGQSDDSMERTFIQKISVGDTGWWGARAVMRHDLESALKKLKTSFIAINSKDDLYPITPRLSEIRPDIQIVTYDDMGFGIFEVQPKVMADLARKTFDG